VVTVVFVGIFRATVCIQHCNWMSL